jgi:secreted PhoX family phosphatase
MPELNRRNFLRAAAVTGGLAAAGPFEGLLARSAAAEPGTHDGYGPLLTGNPDLRDGVVRLLLPEGFEYRSFSWAGDPLVGGGVVPGRQDGMAAFRDERGRNRLVRNHELNGNAPAGALPHCEPYDSAALGGTTTVQVSRRGTEVQTWVSCSGTQNNCSGGKMPWGSWVTAEETVNGPDVGPDFTGKSNAALTKPHGFIYEVPAWQNAENVRKREPVTHAGRFSHESVAFDDREGRLYETEDNFAFPSGFYRYTPPADARHERKIHDGGKLHMLKVKGVHNADLSQGFANGTTFETEWVPIADPNPTMPAGTTNDQALVAVSSQGLALGAAKFSRLEGVIYARGKVYFTSTQGGTPDDTTDPGPSGGFGRGYGQVWAYDPRRQRLTMVYESPSKQILELPDNLTISPRGTLLLCEDGTVDNYLRGLTRDGQLFDFAKNAIAAHENEEFAGATFGAGGQTLYVNIQASSPTLSFAIWGPWHRGAF